MTRYWHAQRVGTREWLSRDLPIDGGPERELSGPGAFRFTVAPEVPLGTPDGGPMFDPWGTLLYLEDSGEIRWAGVVIDVAWNGPQMAVECAGFSTYPHGQPYTGVFSGTKIDPAVIVRHIYEHLQSQKGGDLGVEVVGHTSALVGVEQKEQDAVGADGEPVKDADGKRVKETVTVPYELTWHDYPDCGREIDALAGEAPFEWVESHRWNADKSDVLHTVTIGDRLGAQRDDLSFEQGVNVMSVVPFEQDGDDYASEIHAIGAGEGEKALRASAAVVRPARLRRARVLLAKDVATQPRLESMARGELQYHDARLATTTITVIDHVHAPLGSWSLGDRIRVTADAAWLGSTSVWQRVVAERLVSDSIAVLTLAPVWE